MCQVLKYNSGITYISSLYKDQSRNIAEDHNSLVPGWPTCMDDIAEAMPEAIQNRPYTYLGQLYTNQIAEITACPNVGK